MNLVTSVAEFVKGVNVSNKSLASLERKAGAVAASLKVLAGIAVFRGLVNATFQSADAIGKLADRLGVSTESYIGLAHAANLAGVGSSEFAAVIEKMTKNLGEAALGGGPVEEALNQLGLSAQNLANVSPDEAFLQISDAISKIENPAQRAAIAVDVFGKKGQALLNTMMQGRGAIEAQAAEARNFGTAISRVDAAQIEAANDAITRAMEAFRGLATIVAASLAPAIESAANKVIEWREGITKAIVGIAAFVAALKTITIAQKAIAAGQSVILAFMGPAGWAAIAAGAAAAAAAIFGVDQAFAAIEAKAAEIPQAGKAIAELVKPADDAKKAIEELANANASAQKKLEELAIQIMTFRMNEDDALAFRLRIEGVDEEKISQIVAAQKLLREMTAAEEEVRKESERAAEAQKQLAKAIEERNRIADQVVDQLATPLEQFEREVTRLRDLAEGGIIDEQTFNRGILSAKQQLENALQFEASSPAAVEFGSAADISATTRARNRDIVVPLQSLLEEARKQTASLDQLAKDAADEFAVVNF